MRLVIGSFTLLAGSILVAQVADTKTATTKEIMLKMSIPASNALFDAGSKEKLSAADWAAARKQAQLLIESADLLATPGRMATGQAKGGATKGKAGKAGAANPAGWNAAAKDLHAAGDLAIKAIDKKDLDLMSGDVAEKILNSCSGCHDKYMIK